MEDMFELMQLTSELNTTNTNPVEKPPLPNLPLPGEIRNKIWRMLLTTRYAFKEPKSEGECEAHYELGAAILRVNHQIYGETLGILREENMWIFLLIAFLKKPVSPFNETARLPAVSHSIVSSRFQYDSRNIQKIYLGRYSHALNMHMCPEPETYGRGLTYHIMLMGPESLPYLLQLAFAMLYVDYSPPTFQIELSIEHPVCFPRRRLQEELLEPFSAARGFRICQVKGNVDKTFASSLECKMRPPWQSKKEILELSDAYLRKGDAAVAAGLTKAASFFFEQGSDFTFFAGQTYVDRRHPQIKHVYNSPRIASMLNAFDVRWAKTLLKLQCYADVQCLAASVLGRPGQFQATRHEKIQLVLCCALASLGLGQTSCFNQIMRGLFHSMCEFGTFPTEADWTKPLKGLCLFGSEGSVAKHRKVMVKYLKDLVAYCKEGIEGSMRRIEMEGSLSCEQDIEIPTSQHWSSIAVKYERRRMTWARNTRLPSNT